MFKRFVTIAAISITACGCTWVQLDPTAKNVQIGYAGDIAQCQRLGVISASTQSKVVLERDEAKVQDELYTLARNNGAALGATNLVQHGRPKDGEQHFTAYNCTNLG